MLLLLFLDMVVVVKEGVLNAASVLIVPIYRFPDRSRTKSHFLWHGHDFEGSILMRGYCYVLYHK